MVSVALLMYRKCVASPGDTLGLVGTGDRHGLSLGGCLSFICFNTQHIHLQSHTHSPCWGKGKILLLLGPCFVSALSSMVGVGTEWGPSQCMNTSQIPFSSEKLALHIQEFFQNLSVSCINLSFQNSRVQYYIYSASALTVFFLRYRVVTEHRERYKGQRQ